MMNKSLCYVVFLVLSFTPAMPATAQQAGKKSSGTAEPVYKVVLLPEFYQCYPIKKGDTTFSFESFDGNDKKMAVDAAFDIKKADEIIILKSFYQFPPKAGAVISPPYLSLKVFTFERTGKNSWIATDLGRKEKTSITEHASTIVRADTQLITDAAAGTKQPLIHRYYKVDLKLIDPSTPDVKHNHH